MDAIKQIVFDVPAWIYFLIVLHGIVMWFVSIAWYRKAKHIGRPISKMYIIFSSIFLVIAFQMGIGLVMRCLNLLAPVVAREALQSWWWEIRCLPLLMVMFLIFREQVRRYWNGDWE